MKGRSLVRHPAPRRWRIKLVVSAVAVFCSAIALLAGAAPASASQPQGRQVKTLEVAVKIGPVSAIGPTQHAVSLAGCAPRFGAFDRTDACWGVTLTFVFFINGRPVGALAALLDQSIHLHPGGLRWTENDAVLATASRGRTAPVLATLEASCDKPCHAVAHFRGLLRRGLHGTVDYTDHLRRDQVNLTPTHYKLLWVAPPFAPLNFPHWNSPISYRCDDDLAPQTVANVPEAAAALDPAGCVFPRDIPTLTLPISEFGASAAMIRWAQQHLDGKWGLRSSNRPLNRLGDTAKARENRNKVCRTDWRPNPRVPHVSCDEYPFAGSEQSPGSLLGFSGKECAQVTAVETGKPGQTELQRWKTVEPLGRFSAAAKCVRGSIPLSQNTGAGREYANLVRSERLLPGDPFWVAVTG
jgi:hypothetical protein